MQYTDYTFTPKELPEGLELETAYDLLGDLLATIGFDSFATDEEGRLHAYIPTADADDALLMATLSDYPIAGIGFDYSAEIQPDINWNEEWERHYFEPIILGDGLCRIRAPFHAPDPSVRTELVISPKMAFGTGNHDTTALIIEYLLSDTELEGLRVLDMGCGTGILGLLALKHGARELTAIDIDEWAYQNVLENAELNGLSVPDALQGDASSLSEREPYDLILANITRNILYEDMPLYVEVLASSGRLVLSGFYAEDLDLLRGRAETLGLEPLSSTSSEHGWSMLVLRRP